MLKKLSYTRFKAIRFTLSVLIFVLYLILWLLPDFAIPRIIIYCSVFIFLSIYVLLSILLLRARKLPNQINLIEDELSRKNEGRSAELTVVIFGLAIIVVSFISNSIFNISLEFSTEFALCAYMSLMALYDGLYLYKEWSDLKDAGTDNED